VYVIDSVNIDWDGNEVVMTTEDKWILEVEPSIRNLVRELNRRGFQTYSSCEGHIDFAGRVIPAYVTFPRGAITTQSDIDEVSKIVSEFTDMPFKVYRGIQTLGRIGFSVPVSKRPVPSASVCYDLIEGVEGRSEVYRPETAQRILQRYNIEDVKRSAATYATFVKRESHQ